MVNRLARLAKVAPLLIFAIGLIIYAGKSEATKGVNRQSFVATYQVARLKPGKAPVIQEIQILAAKGSGEYKLVKYYPTTGLTRTLIATKDSVHEVKPDSLQYVDKAWTDDMRRHFYSPKHLMSSAEFVREETVCGLKTLVLRGEGDGDWIEKHYALQMGATALKTVIFLGNGEYIVNEGINVQFRDVSDDEIGLPNLSRRFDDAEQKEKTFRAAGASDFADALQQKIDDEKKALGIR